SVVDGQNASGNVGGQCLGGLTGQSGQSNGGGATASGYIIRRVRVVGCEQGIYGRGMRLESSYVHDLYCQGQAHTEPDLPNQGDVEIIGSTLRTQLRQDRCSGNGGSSAVIACYVHSEGGWDSSFTNGQFIGNWLQVDFGPHSSSGFTV